MSMGELVYSEAQCPVWRAAFPRGRHGETQDP